MSDAFNELMNETFAELGIVPVDAPLPSEVKEKVPEAKKPKLKSTTSFSVVEDADGVVRFVD